MAVGTKSASECIEYWNTLPLPANIGNVAPPLLPDLTPELVLTALENLTKSGNSWIPSRKSSYILGTNGVSVKVHYTGLLGDRVSVPNSQGMRMDLNDHPAPLCLQSVLYKWVTGTIYLMIEDIVRFVTLREQKAFSLQSLCLMHTGSLWVWQCSTA